MTQHRWDTRRCIKLPRLKNLERAQQRAAYFVNRPHWQYARIVTIVRCPFCCGYHVVPTETQEKALALIERRLIPFQLAPNAPLCDPARSNGTTARELRG